MKWKLHIICFVLTVIMLLMMPQGAWATTAYVSTYAELRDAISDASVDVIIVTANIDVPCENSVTSTSTPNYTGSATAQLVIGRSLTLQSQAGSRYMIKRVSASGQTSNILKSIFSIRGSGNNKTGGAANLTENTVEVTFTNIIIDGGADWGESEYCDRHTAATTAYGNSGRAMIDIFLGSTLNLEDGVVLQNGYTTYSINSVVNNSGSAYYGGAVRVEYHADYGGGTVNVKAGAIIHDCTASGYGGALGAYNFARLNLYGGTIYNCSSGNGGAIATTYRSGSEVSTSGTVKMYGGIIHDCCATNGGAISMDGKVSNFLLGGTIENCSASTKGSAICINESNTTVNIVAYDSHLLTITNCSGGTNTSTENTNGYAGVYKNESATIADYPVYHVTFQNNNTTFAVLSVAQGTSLGEAFPAAPVNASFRFVGWYNGNTQVTSATVITDNITVTAKWDFLGSGTSANPYQIPSTDAWNFLADKVNNGNTYSGKYFQLTNNISVTTMVGANNGSKPFGATFDGNGNILNVSIEGSGECTAAFGALSGATVKNLHITGSISTDGLRPGSIAGFISGNSTIENCWSEVAISSSHCASEKNWIDAGAFVGRVSSDHTLTLNGCLFTGSIIYIEPNAYEGGGMVGWCQNHTTVRFYDCVFAPSAISITKYQDQYTFAATYDGYADKTIDHCYYNDVANSKSFIKEGNHLHSITAGTNVTITNLGTATATYNVSGITAYAHGIKCGGTFYAGSGDAVSLNLGYTSHSGYSFQSFTATAGTLTGESNPYTLTMADADATINARYSAAISIAATTQYAKDGWYLIASPIGTVNPSGVANMTSNTYDIFRFNQNPTITGDQYLEWENWKQTGASHYHFNLMPGRGYLYANSGNVTLTFIGTPYSGTGVVNLEYSTSNPDSRMHGWNLIGNPFGVTATIENPFYRMNNAHNEIIPADNSSVAPMEGVFVQATADDQTVTFTKVVQRETAGTEDRIVINLNDTKGTIIDRAIVSFEKGHTLLKFQIKDNSTKLYIPQNGVDYAIAFAYRIGELPMNFKANETGVYTLNFNGENMNGVSLVDMIEGAVIDLSVNDTYTFIGSPNDRENRFKLVFSSPNDSNIEIFAYQTGNEIVVSGEGELQVFDVTGRLVMTQRIEGVGTWRAASVLPGVYILRLNEMVQKIVVR